jgi:nicotinamide riboside transporter PnuC
MDVVFRYYGVDWLAMVSTFLSLWLLGERRRAGFLIGMVAAGFWFAFGILAGSLANPIANTLFFALNLRGYWRWRAAEP